jgi:hypothetical protein
VIVFTAGYYEHNTLKHLSEFIREHGSLIRYNAWVLESLNKWWKEILHNHTSHRTIETGSEALRRMLEATHPDVAAGSMRDVRVREMYHCSKCGEELTQLHRTTCAFRT